MSHKELLNYDQDIDQVLQLQEEIEQAHEEWNVQNVVRAYKNSSLFQDLLRESL